MGGTISFIEGLIDCYESNFYHKECEGCQYLSKCKFLVIEGDTYYFSKEHEVKTK